MYITKSYKEKGNTGNEDVSLWFSGRYTNIDRDLTIEEICQIYFKVSDANIEVLDKDD